VTANTPEKARAQNRLALFLIIGITVAVIIASTLLFTATQKGWIDLPALLGTRNNGALISPPKAIADLPLQDQGGAPFNYAEQKKRWTLLIPAAARCDDACEQALYLTRQVDTALGRESSRVRRYLVATEYPLDPDFAQLLREQHADLQVLHAPAGTFARFVHGIGDGQPPRFYVIDPYGWLMMYYTAQHDGHAVLADLKFLVKNAHENETVE
jgi:hypothetical protein